MISWDAYFLRLAREAAARSKDPSTQVGAVVADRHSRLVSMGYNGFARTASDDPAQYADRAVKYLRVIHAEMNAILFADRDRLVGATLYTWPFAPCARCAAVVAQVGIARVVAPPLSADLAARWADELRVAAQEFREAGIVLVEMTLGDQAAS